MTDKNNDRWFVVPRNFTDSTGSIPWDLYIMHDKFGFHTVELNKQHLRGRLDFLQEELNEAYEALEKNDVPAFVDAHIDLMVVAQGTLDLGHIETWLAWDRVLKANMSKVKGKNEKRHAMQGLDLQKPEGWTAPNHDDNVGILPEIMLRDESYKSATLKEFNPEHRRRAIEFLEECKQIMLEKAADYNSILSPVKTYDYYSDGGLYDIYHMIKIKFLRIKSLVFKLMNGGTIQNESLIETLRDNIVFSAMAVELIEGKMDGITDRSKLFGNLVNDD